MRSLESNASEIHSRIAAIDGSRLRRHVEFLADLGPRSIHDVSAVMAAQEYLRVALRGFGYDVEDEPFDEADHEVNLIATRRGSVPADEVLELGAHYDTVVGTPGADDNASAVAGLLEVARVLVQACGRRRLRFCLFGAEESGLRGSSGHVRRLESGGNVERFAGIVVFEMIGYCTHEPGSQRTPIRIPLLISPPRTGDFIAVVANHRSRRLVTRFEQAAARHVPALRTYGVKHLGGVLRDAARSDHRPYWEAGLPGVMVTDTANFRNPHYHRPTDLPDTLDYRFAAQVAQVTAAMLMEWVAGA